MGSRDAEYRAAREVAWALRPLAAGATRRVRSNRLSPQRAGRTISPRVHRGPKRTRTVPVGGCKRYRSRLSRGFAENDGRPFRAGSFTHFSGTDPGDASDRARGLGLMTRERVGQPLRRIEEKLLESSVRRVSGSEIRALLLALGAQPCSLQQMGPKNLGPTPAVISIRPDKEVQRDFTPC